MLAGYIIPHVGPPPGRSPRIWEAEGEEGGGDGDNGLCSGERLARGGTSTCLASSRP